MGCTAAPETKERTSTLLYVWGLPRGYQPSPPATMTRRRVHIAPRQDPFHLHLYQQNDFRTLL